MCERPEGTSCDKVPAVVGGDRASAVVAGGGEGMNWRGRGDCGLAL